MNVSTLSAGQVRALADQRPASATAYQSVLVAVAHAVERAVARVRKAEAAALSLAQRQKVAAVADDLTHTSEALQEALTEQGRCLLNERRSLRERVREASEKVRATLTATASAPGSWTAALADAVDALDEAAEEVDALAAAQATDAPGCTLGQEVSARLDAHRETLLSETERLRSAA